MASFHELPAYLRLSAWRLLFAISILLFCFHITIQAQSANSSEKANELYQQQAYNAAIHVYDEEASDLTTIEQIANSYRLNHDTENAEIWYGRLIQESTKPIHYLHYAQALHSNGNLELAKDFYLKYAETAATYYDNRGNIMAAAIDQLTDTEADQIVIKNAGVVNSASLDFCPTFYQNGIVFASTRNADGKTDTWTGEGFSKLYIAERRADGSFEEPEAFFIGVASKHHQGPLTFFPNGNAFLFTNNIPMKTGSGEKEHFLKITKAIKDGKQWLRANQIDLGTGLWNDAHPTLSTDGQYLYFASDRPGGYGGMDIYMTKFSNGQWGFPINLGSEINTPGNEVFPFVYADGTLYFASNGWGGYGGLDIFYSETDMDGYWKQASNVGIPINSQKDDFGYALDMTGTSGYFSSARKDGAGKDDIYQFTLPSPQSNKLTHLPNTTICIQDETTGKQLAGAQVNIFSKLTDGSFIGFENDYMVKMVASAENGEYEKEWMNADPFGQLELKNTEFETNKKGQFDLFLESGKSYLFSVNKNGYEPIHIEFEAGNPTKCFTLKPKHCVSLSGIVTDKLNAGIVNHANVTLINIGNDNTLTTTTDYAGQYNLCVEPGSDFIIKVEKEGYSPENGMVSTIYHSAEKGSVQRDLQLATAISSTAKPLTEGSLFAEGIIVELEHIYYDYGQSAIRPDAAKELDNIAQFLKRNPNLSVELRSHTDSRGDDNFNRELSQKRAKAAVTYLMMKGLPKNRLTATGYGEDQLLNDCDDGKDCPEAAHQMNRRTEVKFFLMNSE